MAVDKDHLIANKREIKQAIDAIQNMCRWDKTPQGGLHWAEVFCQLQGLLELVSDNYITPTDEHAKQRPVVEVRNSQDDPWLPMTLVYVAPGNKSHNFKVTNEKGFGVYSFRYCRMKSEG